jgi:16S rRNA (guanine966-N2)-methyltransferase
MGLRIIGGSLRGRKLSVARGAVTRPTANRSREAIFNILYTRVRGSAVLDLFAGSGAMGIEALSRGAEYAVFLDNDKNVCSALKKNIISCGVEPESAVIQCDALKKLDFIKLIRTCFDIVFIDPPYNSGLIEPALRNLVKWELLKKKSDIIVEHSASEALPKGMASFIIADQRKYGKSRVTFLQYR